MTPRRSTAGEQRDHAADWDGAITDLTVAGPI